MKDLQGLRMTNKTDNTRAERQREFRKRMEADGFRFVHLWVPAGREEDIKAIADEMRENKKALYIARKAQQVETYPLPLTRNAATEWNRATVKTDKYQHPQDNTLIWSGRGRKPAWVEAWTAKGGTIDQLLKGE